MPSYNNIIVYILTVYKILCSTVFGNTSDRNYVLEHDTSLNLSFQNTLNSENGDQEDFNEDNSEFMQDFNESTSEDTYGHFEHISGNGINSNFENDETIHVHQDIIKDYDSQTENLQIIVSWLKLKDELNVSNCFKLITIA